MSERINSLKVFANIVSQHFKMVKYNNFGSKHLFCSIASINKICFISFNLFLSIYIPALKMSDYYGS
jgi:hypothetical protein